MAVRLVSAEKIEDNYIDGVVAADVKADVTDNLKFGDNYMAQGSVAYTKAMEYAICDSTGHWNWQE